MNLLIKAGRKSKNFTSEKVCMKKAVVRSGTLAPTLTLTLYFMASPRIYAQAHRPSCRQAGNLDLELRKMWGGKRNGHHSVRVLSHPHSLSLCNLWPRQESNLDLELRKLLYYPLYYEAGGAKVIFRR
jgi:hypothetical protein